MWDVVLVVAGLVCLVLGGEWLLRGAVAIARRLGLSPMVIGLTLVGFGTSTPELVTSLQAALTGSPGIALGNVVGSNIGNILLILGCAALVAPIAVERRALGRDGTVVALATLACAAALALGEITRPAGALLFGGLIVYLAVTLWMERQTSGTAAGAVYADEAAIVPEWQSPLGLSALIALGGLAVTILGARLLVDGAVGVARAMEVSETVIGLTIVAIGTSTPELVTSILAVRKGEGSVALGNIIGSNIFNILGILGITALVAPLSVPADLGFLDIGVLIAATLAFFVVAVTGWRVGRGEGAALVLAYAAYVTFLVVNA